MLFDKKEKSKQFIDIRFNVLSCSRLMETKRKSCKKSCPHTDLNYGPLHYECNALPLSYAGAVSLLDRALV